SGGVVGGVEHFGDFGKLFLDEPLDAGLERDVGRAAALAATAHREIDAIVLDVDQLHVAAVPGDRGVDHRIDQLLHPGLEIRALVRALGGHGITSWPSWYQTAMVRRAPCKTALPPHGPTRSIKAT